MWPCSHKGRWHRRLVSAVLIAGAWCTEALAEGGFLWSKPRDISAEGWRMDWLTDITMWFIVALFLAMVAWMFGALILHGRKHKAFFTMGDQRKITIAKLTVAGLIFFGVDGNLFYNSTIDTAEAFWNFRGADEDPDVLRVEVQAQQWAWRFRLPGPDGEFRTPDDIVTIHDLYVPMDRQVLFQIASSDVLHSLYLPNLRVKQDVVPGQVTFARFKATESGTFEVACAQHCGNAHYKMKGHLHIMQKPDFQAWEAQAATNAERQFDPNDQDAQWGWPWQEIP